MLHVALLEPEIPPNTGNIARLCAATGAALHLIGRLGFRIDDRSLRRAGLDSWQHVDVRRHATLADFERTFTGGRIFCFSARASILYTRAGYADGDCLLLCSDGLSDMVSDAEIRELLAGGGSSEARCQRLVDRALAAGGNDNVTVIVARFE